MTPISHVQKLHKSRTEEKDIMVKVVVNLINKENK